jgi:hypothetical protein
MDFYKQVNGYYNGQSSQPQGLQTGTVNTFNAINIPYGDYLLPSNSMNRQGAPGPGTFGTSTSPMAAQVIIPMEQRASQNSAAVKSMNNTFLGIQQNPSGYAPSVYTDNFSGISLQQERPENYVVSQHNAQGDLENYDYNQIKSDYYVSKASQSLHQNTDPLMRVFFSDDNISHLRTMVVRKVKEITADSGVAGDNQGVTIQLPNLDDFFYYMVNIFQNYKIHNGSICFVNLKNTSNLKAEISKLNTNVLQEYVSKMVSQINMYIYYYKDASQIPDQLSIPRYTSMKGSRSLEYNNGFIPGNSLGVASYNEVGNIL